jgi:hypothetical protein
MAKKITPLTFRDIVLGAEAEVIRQALEARAQIDELITERQAAYERIAALENQVEDVLGETGTFPFPAPPLPVAGFDPKSDTVTRSAAAVKKVAAALDSESAKEEEPSDEAEDETEVEASEDDTEEKDA